MQDIYEIYEFTYKCKNQLDLLVGARSIEIANSIVEIYNTRCNTNYKLRRFFNKKKIYITIPPYDYEQSEAEYAEDPSGIVREHIEQIKRNLASKEAILQNK